MSPILRPGPRLSHGRSDGPGGQRRRVSATSVRVSADRRSAHHHAPETLTDSPDELAARRSDRRRGRLTSMRGDRSGMEPGGSSLTSAPTWVLRSLTQISRPSRTHAVQKISNCSSMRGGTEGKGQRHVWGFKWFCFFLFFLWGESSIIKAASGQAAKNKTKRSDACMRVLAPKV